MEVPATISIPSCSRHFVCPRSLIMPRIDKHSWIHRTWKDKSIYSNMLIRLCMHDECFKRMPAVLLPTAPFAAWFKSFLSDVVITRNWKLWLSKYRCHYEGAMSLVNESLPFLLTTSASASSINTSSSCTTWISFLKHSLCPCDSDKM